jgi:hypothetical protein
MKANTWCEIHNVKLMIAGYGFHIEGEDVAPATSTEKHMKLRLPDVDLVMTDHRGII